MDTSSVCRLPKKDLLDKIFDMNFDNVKSNDSGRKPRSRRKCIRSLKKICISLIEKANKASIAKVFAENTWENICREWISKKPQLEFKDIQSEEFEYWFSHPNIDSDGKIRFHFTDAFYILTCIRTKLCTTGISGLRRKAWEIAALSKRTNLYISVILDCIDKQDVALARQVFAEDVEMAMPPEYKEDAIFCRLIREWFETEDEPSIDVEIRCQKRIALRQWLLNGYKFTFPPYTQYIKGIPITTFEALVCHIERKIQIFPFCNGQMYNVRSIGSQQAENFFSTFRDMDSTGQGTPKPDTIPDMMTSVATLDNFRIDPNRSFYMATSSASVYPQREYEQPAEDSDTQNVSVEAIAESINRLQIEPKNHFFDSLTRDEKKHRRKVPGLQYTQNLLTESAESYSSIVEMIPKYLHIVVLD